MSSTYSTTALITSAPTPAVDLASFSSSVVVRTPRRRRLLDARHFLLSLSLSLSLSCNPSTAAITTEAPPRPAAAAAAVVDAGGALYEPIYIERAHTVSRVPGDREQAANKIAERSTKRSVFIDVIAQHINWKYFTLMIVKRDELSG